MLTGHACLTFFHQTVPVIVETLAEFRQNLSIRIVLTESACHFLAGQSAEQPTVSSLLQLPCVDAVYRDQDEWGPELWRRGASILHIESVSPVPSFFVLRVSIYLMDNLTPEHRWEQITEMYVGALG
jgi:hypothetical protein